MLLADPKRIFIVTSKWLWISENVCEVTSVSLRYDTCKHFTYNRFNSASFQVFIGVLNVPCMYDYKLKDNSFQGVRISTSAKWNLEEDNLERECL